MTDATANGVTKKPATNAAATRHARTVWARTQVVLEVLLKLIEDDVNASNKEHSDQWLKVFGPKDSAIANLQKLVDLLGELKQHQPPKRRTAVKTARSTEAELAMLVDWVRTSDANAANASRVAE